ncbi:tRNA pseudouridine(38-40) synthase TruA [Proteiniborus sp. MB09-C3]|uniref:tRNA pseudouridine(38-40) synthase TruA n=1 Tax=Proteiniborus sp. MB09-C3 TaxID=3050072 RepID=UPI00255232D5|nr:tRNA pseudouridine(38-40) synthase TruA [Proteiniborus sp. MB09-C3]WIV13184.1 tRNA pseudouridine(38-40) synthase TruA [Proteiniborus sp. MB09-C3]
MRNIKLIIEYDGTNYFGWQKQPHQKTIQEAIEYSIKKITKEDVGIFGSGRTDRGVHARGQVANFFTEAKIPGEKFKDAINSVLPSDIVISHSEEVDCSFHSRYSAQGKEYRYVIYNRRIPSPLLRNYAYHVPQKLHFDLMQKASADFIGTHDFTAFMASGSSVKDTTRTIYSIHLNKNHEIIELKINGNGFLYNMVRIIAGTLVDIGIGKIDSSYISEILLSKDRKNAGHTAPPHGLYLEKVFY